MNTCREIYGLKKKKKGWRQGVNDFPAWTLKNLEDWRQRKSPKETVGEIQREMRLRETKRPGQKSWSRQSRTQRDRRGVPGHGTAEGLSSAWPDPQGTP